MKNAKAKLLVLVVVLAVAAAVAWSSSHREAPITALDHKADITDVYAFVSYGADQAMDTPPSKVTLILGVDPLLEPANGPNLFPFDPSILYEIYVDNNHDAQADVTFQFDSRRSSNFQVSILPLPDSVSPAPSTPKPAPSLCRRGFATSRIPGSTCARPTASRW